MCPLCCCGLPADNLPDPAEVAEERGESGRLGTVTVGFGHDAVLGVAGAVVDAVKTGMAQSLVDSCPLRQFCFQPAANHLPAAPCIMPVCGSGVIW